MICPHHPVISLNSSPLTSLPCPLSNQTGLLAVPHICLASFCLRLGPGSCLTGHSFTLFLEFCMMGSLHLMFPSHESVLTVFKITAVFLAHSILITWLNFFFLSDSHHWLADYTIYLFYIFRHHFSIGTPWRQRFLLVLFSVIFPA